MSLHQHRRPSLQRTGSLFIPYVKAGLGALALAAAMALLTSCGGGSNSSSSTSPPTPIPTAALKIAAATTLFPAFDPSITDYVCTAQSGVVQVSVQSYPGVQVSVDGQTARSGNFSTKVSVTAGQSFAIIANSAGTASTYYVRCVPDDFPTWTVARTGTPQAEYYGITPNDPTGSAPVRDYLIITDGYGSPIWWYKDSAEPRNATILSNGDIAWTDPTAVVEHKLDGSLVRTISVDKSNYGLFDSHELQQLSNGDFIIIADVPRSGIDLSAIGGTANGAVVDNEIEEISPTGALVWSWSALDHVPVTECDQVWWSQFITGQAAADPYHMNSVEPNGSGFVVSLRNTDAVFRIDKATGNIVWKLGGTQTAQSLTFKGDTYGNFGGQHDARILPDGTLTIHDNGSGKGRAPRAARFTIDTTANTATFVEQVVDPEVPSSYCCGSARKLPTGDWVVSWGSTPIVTELTPAGAKVFHISFNQPYFSYRALPVLPGVLNRAALRSGMDAQFPRVKQSAASL